MSPEAAALLIVDYRPEHRSAFRDLNLEWLRAYFRVEAKDEATLGDPHTFILAKGGAILMALWDGEPVGTCALLVHDGAFELAKMAVTARMRGKGIGRALLLAAIDRFDALGGTTLFLETNATLLPAIALYESVGFRRQPFPSPSPYQRADVYMRYVPMK